MRFMKLLTFCISIVFTISTAVSAIAGGVSCQFKADGMPLLSQSPVLAEILTSKFKVLDGGKMGPMDAPFDGGRQYTYMEFRASTVSKEEKKFIFRLHFKKQSRVDLAFEKAEFLPVTHFPAER